MNHWYTQPAMSTTAKPFVLMVGGTGHIGRGVTKALLEEGKFVSPCNVSRDPMSANPCNSELVC